MRILLTNNHLQNWAGSETWTYTMAKELVRQGHTVEVSTFHTGAVSDLLPTVPYPAEEYDLCIVNHNTCLEKLKHIKGYKIFTCHGTKPPQEKPIDGADAYVAISDEISEYMEGLGYKNTIIHNGVDRQRFAPTTIGKGVLSLGKTIEAANFAQDVAKLLGVPFHWAKGEQNVEDRIRDAFIVFTYGRGALESMSMGRQVYIYDARPYQPAWADGLLTTGNYKTIRATNFSGRAYKHQHTPEMAYNIICDEYEQDILKLAEKHNIKNQAKKYIELYDQRNNQN